ncbi:uncharacterized protein LOC105442149 [Strongylocentrotus purpuratus]|uniref:ZU5 domain-containing protein n=1 Tax=Strongylocentrotus purpuratus TaxID=7668 RepID=A0A7M7NYE3_STRPU|nr:uncharacterized protein LOC105442149 [Strongylocentrotus purpuratus]
MAEELHQEEPRTTPKVRDSESKNILCRAIYVNMGVKVIKQSVSRVEEDEDHFQSLDEAMGQWTLRGNKLQALSTPRPPRRKRPRIVDSDNPDLLQLNISAEEFILQANADTPQLNETDYSKEVVTAWIETGDFGQLSDPGPSDVSSKFKAAPEQLLHSTYTTRQGYQLPSEKQRDSLVGVHVDAANSSRVTRHTFIGQQNIIKSSRYSHVFEDDSLDEPSTKRHKKTKRKTDSSDEDERTSRDKQKTGHGSKDDCLDGRPRKRTKKTNRKTDSSDEDERTSREKQRKSHGSKDDCLDGRPRKRTKKTNRQTDSSDEDNKTRGGKHDDSLVGPQRVLSIDEQHEYEDKRHSEGIFDQTGGELHIPSYGLTLSIPPGALPEGSCETITLDVLKNIPPEITLRHDETLVTYGFQCLPPGLQFVSEKPVRLKIPHCANLIDPSKVQVVLYSMNHGKAM